MKLPRPLYEAKPFLYIFIGIAGLYYSNIATLSQVVYILLCSAALMILFLRRAFRQGIIKDRPFQKYKD
jgi:hypothetical protein